ncbi:hypothetical protein AAHB94_08465 [Bacillus toyonensis]
MVLDSIKDSLRILRNKKRYPNAIIESSSINKSVKIGDKSIVKKMPVLIRMLHWVKIV